MIAVPVCAFEQSTVYECTPINRAKDTVKERALKLVNYCKHKSEKPITVAHQNIAVIPVDVSIAGDVQSIYTNTLSLISEDISNRLNKSNQLTSPHLAFIEEKIKMNNLEPTLKKFMSNYKNRYMVDYDSLKTLAETLNVDKILLISGDFDTRHFLLKPNLAYDLNVPEVSVLKPSYRIHTTATFIDPIKQLILWEKVFVKDFKVANFDVPSIKFANNVIPVNEIKSFSREISPKIVRNIFLTLPASRIQTVKQNIISTQTLNHSKLKDDTMTTDGHSYSTNTRNLELERKNKYSEWVDENL